MKKGSGISPSSLAAIVAAIVVGTSVTVQDIRARQAVERHDTPESAQAAPRMYAADALPSAMIPGFDPDRDIGRIQKMVAGGPRPVHRTPAQVHAPPQKAPRPADAHATGEAVAPAPRQEVVATHPRLTFEDVTALQHELMQHAEAVQPLKRPYLGPAPDSTAQPTARTVAAYLVAEPQGVSLLVYTRDEHGQARHKLELSGTLGQRLEHRVAEDKPGFTLLMIERLYGNRSENH